MTDLPIGCIAAGHLPQGLSPGDFSPDVTNMTAQNQGTGIWEIKLSGVDKPPDTDVFFAVSPAPGSGISGGVSWGITQVTAGDWGLLTFRVDTAAALDVAMYFAVFRRR